MPPCPLGAIINIFFTLRPSGEVDGFFAYAGPSAAESM
jgi:hypothetical protein